MSRLPVASILLAIPRPIQPWHRAMVLVRPALQQAAQAHRPTHGGAGSPRCPGDGVREEACRQTFAVCCGNPQGFLQNTKPSLSVNSVGAAPE